MHHVTLLIEALDTVAYGNRVTFPRFYQLRVANLRIEQTILMGRETTHMKYFLLIPYRNGQVLSTYSRVI